MVFIIAAFFISRYINRGSADLTVDMASASLPVMNVTLPENAVNTMHGYRNEVDLSRFRAALSPLDAERGINVHVTRYGAEVTGMYYEVRSLNGDRLIERTEIEQFTAKDDQIDAHITVKDLIEPGEEYSLCVVLKDADQKDIRYYTRIIYSPDFHTKAMTSFVRDFTIRTFNKDMAQSIGTYLESDATGDNTSYAKVNIHSSLGQVTWGNLSPKLISGIETTILEMDPITASFSQEYEIEAGPEGARYRYEIKEYFRIRYSEERMYLLEYERGMNEIFDADRDHFINDKIMLGIHDPDIVMKENSEGDALAFVMNGALYCYRSTDSRIVRIFSFTDEENVDERAKFNDHDIRVLTIDEGGNIRFMVYGYMNRGRHEGEICASIYYYDSSFNTIEEEVCIPYGGSYQMYKNNVEILSYSDQTSRFYLYLDGSIYRVLLDSHQAERIASGIAMDDIVASPSGRTAAWVNRPERTGKAGIEVEVEEGESSITLMDFSSGASRVIEPGARSINTPLGFIGEDFVYGISATTDLIRTTTGSVRYAMNTIRIENRSGELLKEYNGGGAYISDVVIDENTIHLSRIAISPETGRYEEVADDQIMGGGSSGSVKNKIITVSTEDRENITEIQLKETVAADALQLMTPEEVLFEGGRIVDLEGRGDLLNIEDYYPVYAKNAISAIYSDPAEAVATADRDSGVVIHDSGVYVWRKGGRNNEYQISGIETAAEDALEKAASSGLAVCLDTIYNLEGIVQDADAQVQDGNPAKEILAETINGTVLDLEGCSLDEMLYYIAHDTPVLAVTETGNLLIVGYDTKNISVLDPEAGDIHKIGLNDSRDLFERSGNGFITYLK